MAIIKDSFGNEINRLDQLGGQALIDTRIQSYSLAATNAEVVLNCTNTNSVAIEVRGTFVGTMVCQYSIDGLNYDLIPLFNPLTEVFVQNITSATGKFVAHLPSGAKQVRVLMTAFTSGSALVTLRGSEGDNFLYSKPIPTTTTLTVTAAISTGATLNIPAGGLFIYITRLRISKYVGTTLTAAATPAIVTSTNINGTPSFDFKTLGAQGDIEAVDLFFTANPLKSATSGTNVTFVAPVLTGAIWKITAFYYLGN